MVFAVRFIAGRLFFASVCALAAYPVFLRGSAICKD
jgi:hypothetical protein